MNQKKLFISFLFLLFYYPAFGQNFETSKNNYSTQAIVELVMGCVNGIAESSQGMANPIQARNFCYCVVNGARNEYEEKEFVKELNLKGFGAVLKYVHQCNAKFNNTNNPHNDIRGLL